MKNVLKAVRKINRKSLKHAKRTEILTDKFEGLTGPIDTRQFIGNLKHIVGSDLG